ncbi:MAG: TylF/MycF family methyltransferase [Helicobacteraceae bacterium]|nr:TylF/MycF family methyltransferase [Helicobacteraceae bacterium]
MATLTGIESVPKQLVALGVDRNKISIDYALVPLRARIIFLEKLAQMFDEARINGSVAEGGIFQGDFAKEINRVFPDKTLYLFDAFEGFDKRDVAKEVADGLSESDTVSYFNATSEEIVKAKLPHPDRCVIKKGYFPETAAGVEDRFCFVNLDFDLYDPILAGLEFFYPLMTEGGVILIHDYFNPFYKGVKLAVDGFAKANDARLLPVGDGFSIAVLR